MVDNIFNCEGHHILHNDATFLAIAASIPDDAKSMMDEVKEIATWRGFLRNLTPK